MGLGMLGAIGGLGEAGVSVGKQMFADASRNELQQQQMEYLMRKQEQLQALEEGRQKRMLQFQEELKNAPVNRANEAIRQSMNSEVPLKARDVTELSGNESPDRGGLRSDFRGNVNELVNRMFADPKTRIQNKDDRATVAEALNNQLLDARRAEEAKVEGQTRKVTPEEAMQNAKGLLASDLQALEVLKKVEPEKYMKIGKDDTILDPKTGRVIYHNTAGADQLEERLNNKLELAKLRNEVLGQSGGGGLPSDAKMSEWLVAEGVYPDKKTAYEHVKQGKDKDDVALQASVYASLMKDNVGGDPKETWRQAGQMIAGSRAKERGAPEPAQSSGKPWERKW